MAMEGPQSLASLEAILSQNVMEETVASRSLSSVVKVYIASAEKDYINAHDFVRAADKTVANGVAINTTNGPRLLMTASVTQMAVFLQVQRNQSDEMFDATVYARCIDSDLALIAVKDSKFWKGLQLIPLADTPALRSEVLIAGFLPEEKELSVTKGVVSRIESQPYRISYQELPAVTVDASTWQSGSSAAVFNNAGELIGIRFQKLVGAENVTLVIPPAVVKYFLDGVAKFGADEYKGHPEAGIQVQLLTNPYIRQHFQLSPDSHGGILVTEVRYGHTCYGMLQDKDVITHIGTSPVSNKGTVPFENGRITWRAAFSMYQCGDTISLRIVRDGKPLTVQDVAKPCACLVQVTSEKNELSYVQWAGLVFRKLTVEYAEASDYTATAEVPSTRTSSHLWHLCFWGQRTKDKDCAIVLSRVMSDPVNVSYERLVEKEIISVNGHSIKNLKDLMHRINSSPTKLVRFETVEGDVIAVPSPMDPASSKMMARINQKYAPSPASAQMATCCTIL